MGDEYRKIEKKNFFQNFGGLGPNPPMSMSIFLDPKSQKHVLGPISSKNDAMIVIEGLLESYWPVEYIEIKKEQNFQYS